MMQLVVVRPLLTAQFVSKADRTGSLVPQRTPSAPPPVLLVLGEAGSEGLALKDIAGRMESRNPPSTAP